MKNNVNLYNPIDDGKYGKAFECSVTEADKVKSAHKVDWTHLKTRYELKTGAGQLRLTKDGKHIAGCKKILYIPVPNVAVNGFVSKYAQEGFILDRDVFLQVLKEVGLFREAKITTQGTVTAAIQTFWNRSKKAPHGKKYYALIDALYENCEETLEEMLNREAKN